ncbi:MAG: hypothetical protein EZS28_000295 [Streblomastix strix]|uniref:Uncharacterized protein n=1 Tax=Streblomastix strix TaxID=222440 RepID=A0A5J4XBJ9_9EUKA|nr:MAG: hypothetical protein EZS28_000295 [Streblomastix strix]
MVILLSQLKVELYGFVGTSTEYSRGDHQYPLQVSENIPQRDSATGAIGTSTSYSRDDHQHMLNTDPTVTNKPMKDRGTGVNGSFNYYARSDHQHPLNIDPTITNVPLVNASAASNGTSDYYCRNDHVHPQQLTYDSNITATKFFKTGGLASEILCANGDTTNKNSTKSQSFPQVVGATAKFIKLCRFEAYNNYGDINVEFKFYSRNNFIELKVHVTYDPTGLKTIIYHYLQQVAPTSFRLPTMLYYGTGLSKYGELWMTVGNYQGYEGRIDLLSQTMYGSPVVSDMLTNQIVATLPSDFTTKEDLIPNLQQNTETINNAKFTQNDSMQINPTATSYDDGLRIAKSGENSGNSSIQIGCSRTSNIGAIVGQWLIFTLPNTAINNPQTDGNTLSFNGSIIAGTGTTGSASSGSVNYSAGNPILWGINSVDTTGGFYSNGTNICWRARSITLGSIPP